MFANQWFDILFSKSVNLRQVEDPKLKTAAGAKEGEVLKAFWVSDFSYLDGIGRTILTNWEFTK